MMEKHGIQNHSTFTGKGPRKGWRTPLSKVKYREQRDEEKERSRGPFASERGDEPRSGIPYCTVYSYTYFGARYMDHELMTMWLSVDPMADKYPGISPYAYCAWNPVKLVDLDGREMDVPPTKKKKYENANSNNRQKFSKISWGETSGIYPMKNPNDPNNKKLCYNPVNWDEKKTEELLKARAAIHLIGTQRNSTVHKGDCDMNNTLQRTLATYHLTSNFPDVDAEILNDENVKYFFLSPDPIVATPSLDPDGQECVMSYGPFYNVGGGDAG